MNNNIIKNNIKNYKSFVNENKNYRYKAVTKDGLIFKQFTIKSDIENFINIESENRDGIDWRVGYLIKFKDGLELEFMKNNGDEIKM